MILGISGVAGSGKDTVAGFLENRHFVRVAMADPLKRIARDVYAFTVNQLWGPSQYRNGLDKRYPREHTWKVMDNGTASCGCCGATSKPDAKDDVQCFLTPRYALQWLGTEFGRHCYENTWADYAIRIADGLGRNTIACYSQQQGATAWTDIAEGVNTNRAGVGPSTAIPDVRFRNEISAIKKAGGKVIRVRRSTAGLAGAAGMHQSEAEQLQISDTDFDYVLQNDATLDELRQATLAMLDSL